MKIVVPLEELAGVLSRGMLATKADPVVGSALRGFGRIECRSNRLSIQSTGPVVSARSTIRVDDDDSEEGACCLSLEKMAAMLKFSPRGESVVLQHFPGRPGDPGYLKLRAGKSSVKLPCANARGFPTMEEPAGREIFSVSHDALSSSVAAVSFAAMAKDADNVRSYICLQTKAGDAYACATNGMQFCIKRMCDAKSDGKAFLPVKLAKGLGRFLSDEEDVRFVDLDNKTAVVQSDRFVVYSKAVEAEARFPDPFRFFELELAGEVSVPAEHFGHMLGACRATHPEECLLSVEGGEVSVRAVSGVDQSEYRASVAYSGNCQDLEAGLHPLLVGEFLSRIKTDAVFMTFSKSVNRHGWPDIVKLADGERFVLYVRTRAAMVSIPLKQENA